MPLIVKLFFIKRRICNTKVPTIKDELCSSSRVLWVQPHGPSICSTQRSGQERAPILPQHLCFLLACLFESLQVEGALAEFTHCACQFYNANVNRELTQGSASSGNSRLKEGEVLTVEEGHAFICISHLFPALCCC